MKEHGFRLFLNQIEKRAPPVEEGEETNEPDAIELEAKELEAKEE